MTTTADGAPPAPGTVADARGGLVRLFLTALVPQATDVALTGWQAHTVATALRLAAADTTTWQACRSCQAPIVWGSTANAKRSMPLDPGDHPGGNLVAWWHDDRLWVRGRKPDEQPDAAKGEHLVVSHFATCPQADQHRKTR